MKRTIVLFVFGASLAYLLSNYAAGAAASGAGNLTGARGSSGCSCHNSTSGIGTTVELDSAGVPVTHYYGGHSYTVKISATNSTGTTGLSGFGFQVSLVKLSGAGGSGAITAGTWGTLPASTHTTTTGSCNVVEQSSSLTPTSGTGGAGTVYSESIPWTAPAAGTGSVKIYGVLNAVNNNGRSSGDDYQVAPAVTITEATISLTASVSISITSGTNPACAGSGITFTATPTNGGTAPSYQWKINGTTAGTNSPTFNTSALTNGDTVRCIMTSNLSGVSGSPATSNAIVMVINPTVTPSVSINTSTTTVCAGTSVSFTATPTNGGTPSYQWQVNGVNAGTNSATFTTSSLTNGQTVSCIMTSTATCASPATATSNSIVMTVNPSVTPTLSINTPSTSVCAGSSVVFTATPGNGGATPAYQWKINGANTGTNSSTFSTAALVSGDTVSCVLTSSATCAVPATAYSNTVIMTVNPTVAPSLTISTASDTICAGASVTFTAIPVNGGSSPSYQWKVNGSNAGTNSPTFTTASLSSGSVVSCTLTSNAPCLTTSTANSNNITIITGSYTPSVTIHANTASVCNGAPDTFTAIAFYGGLSPAYQWKVNGVNQGSNSPTFIYSGLTTGSVVSCTLTSSLSCASPSTANSNTLTITVNPTVVPTTSIVTSRDTVCQGAPVSFTAGGTNLGSSPTYQWTVNGSSAGTNNAHFNTSSLNNGAVVQCSVTSSAACASPATVSSNTVTMNVVSSPSVTITPSGNIILCLGDTIRLNATGAGHYLWSNGDTASTVRISQSDTVSLIGYNGLCPANAPVAAIIDVYTPSVATISQNGTTLTSSIESSYQWYRNDTLLPGDTLRSLTTTASGNYTVATTDLHSCHAVSTAYAYTYVNGITELQGELQVRIYPVPNRGSFEVEYLGAGNAGVSIIDLYGRTVAEMPLTGRLTKVNLASLAPAVYFVRIADGNNTRTLKMQVAEE